MKSELPCSLTGIICCKYGLLVRSTFFNFGDCDIAGGKKLSRLLHTASSSSLAHWQRVAGTVWSKFSPILMVTSSLHMPISSGIRVILFPFALMILRCFSFPICFGNPVTLLHAQLSSFKSIRSVFKARTSSEIKCSLQSLAFQYLPPSSGGNSVIELNEMFSTSSSRPIVHTTSSTRFQPRYVSSRIPSTPGVGTRSSYSSIALELSYVVSLLESSH
mmetsp:Transcript_75995/g.148895  ORF Transcript_75995/g.148895 Transcript_75995/m.148895 type:complete len:218 (+) Transcript_75995:293-946(+)